MNGQQVKQYFDENSEMYEGEENPFRPVKLTQFERFIEPGDSVLDIGCGSCHRLESICKHFPVEDGYGLDLSSKMMPTVGESPFILLQGTATDLPIQDGSIDIIHMQNVLHHLVGESQSESLSLGKQAIGECVRVLKKEGYLIISEQYLSGRIPDKNISYIIFSLLKHSPNILSIVDSDAREGLLVNFYPENKLKDLMEQHDLDITSIKKRSADSGVPLLATPLLRDIGQIHISGRKV